MMPRYFAQVQDGIVQRVLVCDDPQWLTDRLGGTWVETADPYTDEPTEDLEGVAYCSPGFGVDESFPERFAPQWVQPVATPDGWTSYPKGALVWHDGRIKKSTMDNNTWHPDVTGWHDHPIIEGVRPRWSQPLGAHDTWPLGFIVRHNGSLWESLIPANATEPGSDPRWWKNLTEPEPDPNEPQPWKPWDGHNSSLYQVGDRVTHNGQTWTATVGNNHWEPGAPGTASLWVAD